MADALEPGRRQTVVFFRDDDMRHLVEPLQAVMQTLRESGVPCSYEVVPEDLADEVVGMALEEKAKAPTLIHFHQHGLRHQHIVDGQVDFAEFGWGRPLDDQLRDIRTGRELLQARLGAAFDGDVFTPPCHKYDLNTLKALEQTGFSTLSAGVRISPAARVYYGLGRTLRRVGWLGKRVSYHGRAIPGTGLVELSTCIDFDLANGADQPRSLDELWQEFCSCRQRLAIVGVNLHHACYVNQGKVDVLRRFVERLAGSPGIVFSSMRDILAGMGARPAKAGA
ncbi:MAG: hypothetical protein H6838_09450 [Planctomycetes bacterium]|nr:hypothetical protein [Planctomycetota bacterium]